MSGNTDKRYPAELRVRAVRMYYETRPDYEGDWPAMIKVAELVGVSTPELTGAIQITRFRAGNYVR